MSYVCEQIQSPDVRRWPGNLRILADGPVFIDSWFRHNSIRTGVAGLPAYELKLIRETSSKVLGIFRHSSKPPE